MEEEDDHSILQSFAQLIDKHPDFDMSTVEDVLQQCNHNYEDAYQLLCEMVIPPDASSVCHNDNVHTLNEAVPVDDILPKVSSPPHKIHYAYSSPPLFHTPEYDSILAITPTDDHVDVSVNSNNASSAPSLAPKHTLHGAWAHKSMGRKYRVDQMCSRYEWIARSVVEDLFNKYHDCVELVENDILHMFPIDEPEAYGGGQQHPSDPPGQPSTLSPAKWPRTAQSAHRRRLSTEHAIAESLRQQAAEEIRQHAYTPETIHQPSEGMDVLRKQLWETRQARTRLQQLANQTRKANHIANAKDKDAELRHLSKYFLGRIRQSEEYRKGVIDLHGLTKEESLQLIEWKLAENGRRRFRVITGKGVHSHNGQAVLRPALEKFFHSRGISYSVQDDAVMSILP